MCCDDQSATGEGVANCGSCRHRIDMGRKDRIICLAHLDFRQLADGESCSEYESKREPVPEADTEQPCELSRCRGAAA